MTFIKRRMKNDNSVHNRNADFIGGNHFRMRDTAEGSEQLIGMGNPDCGCIPACKQYEVKIRMTREELIRDVIGYEGIYTIDIFGNVFRVKDGKEMLQQRNQFGYMNVSLSKDGKQKQHKIHRLIAQAFILNPQNKEQVNHIDGDKTHNVVWNLEWVTSKENNIHASDTGLVRKARKVRIVETGEIFNSLGSCARAINGNTGDISRCIHSKGTKTHKGYTFEEVV